MKKRSHFWLFWFSAWAASFLALAEGPYIWTNRFTYTLAWVGAVYFLVCAIREGVYQAIWMQPKVDVALTVNDAVNGLKVKADNAVSRSLDR